MSYITGIIKHKHIKNIKVMTQVVETEMYDGTDLIHNWKSVKDALNSGRFDYLYEDLEMHDLTEQDIENCKSVEELIDVVGYPFILQK